MNEPFIFISYRRSDTTPYALAIKAELEQRLRSAFVFVDIYRIQGTDRWSDILDNALTRARVLIVLIGPNWIEHEGGTVRPRLFDDDDWVRKEICAFTGREIAAVLPVLVGGAQMPTDEMLPDDLAELTRIQAIKLDPPFWPQCIDKICQVLASRFGFELEDYKPRNPGKSHFRSLTSPLDQQTLDKTLREFLRDWKVELKYEPNEYAAMSQWLVRTFNFPSFGTAMRFLQAGAAECEQLDHHPNWENCFKQVVVRMTTWNAGHRITQYDVDLAHRLDRIAAKLLA